MFNARGIFTGITEAQKAGVPAALVTITHVSGSSVRHPGTHMAVTAEGAMFGSLSGGCIEHAVIAEARQAIENGKPHCVRYGRGSPFIDIRLPCGGSVDLLINPLASERNIGRDLTSMLARRRPFALRLPRHEGQPEVGGELPEGRVAIEDDFIVVRHSPPLRLVIAGHGATVDCLRDLALASDIETQVFSPDEQQIERSLAAGAAVTWLRTSGSGLPLSLDHRTAFAMLFHDHDWEPSLLAGALDSPAFYIGAMGSRKTHAERCERLRGLGVVEADVERIVSPIGLIPSLRDPETLAISVLAQVVDGFNRLPV